MDEKNPGILQTRVFEEQSADSTNEGQTEICTIMSPSNLEKGEESDLPPDQVEPPDGGYGWVCVACTMGVCGTGWGLNSAYGIFLAHYLSYDVFPGATPLDYAYIGGIGIGAGLLAAPVANLAIRNLGLKPSLLIGTFLQLAGCIVASFATHIWHLYVSQGLLMGLAIIFLFAPAVTVPPQWFKKKRSLANGLTVAGSGIGGVLIMLAAQEWINKWGLAWCFRATAIMTFVINMTAVILIREISKVKPTFAVWDFKFLKQVETNAYFLWVFFSLAGYVVMLYSMSPAAKAAGLTDNQATNISALLSAFMAFGRPFIGHFSDRYGRVNIVILSAVLVIVLEYALWLPANSYGMYIAYSILNGFVLGTVWVGLGPIAAEIAGLSSFQTLSCMGMVGMSIPGFFSEVVAIKIRRDGDKPYLWPIVYSSVAFFFSILSAFVMREYAIRRQMVAKREEDPSFVMPGYWCRMFKWGRA
ncbi:major facilitator superfamily domain-containing protein [Yarrowia lipolytica]|jgi:MFS family permease|uniref:YALI0E34903p n=2 Tax=Yarrowia lipolytica TaxID=4952 RepID=Q6C3H0_YARLI|nr:YALI0E34903p [Yarrowia lipolytica CLIB122]AOW06408.1 hypothetical protein YALI1_E41436g [Yarrowia lipolytica]KAB8282609.1 major facilitator superfamily domain-containing protein [Yarrowia lipolytica]KAE8172037.1 major facilitator superfamily domain-containing protein [Yarrowia lipolytica]KAJ8057776.1 major facilitator superfamily domain-containing protein [Yarrowia lipolytica]QNQ00930.1 Putative transporter MCH2 [Yarrowia lipolytica]|eukprot:XP_504792.1 YALI0E34903p [Yarrowia lipolytica CLIB122]